MVISRGTTGENANPYFSANFWQFLATTDIRFGHHTSSRFQLREMNSILFNSSWTALQNSVCCTFMPHNLFKLGVSQVEKTNSQMWQVSFESQWLVVQSYEGNWRKVAWLWCKVSLCGLREQHKRASISTWLGIAFLPGQLWKYNRHCFVVLFKSYRIR